MSIKANQILVKTPKGWITPWNELVINGENKEEDLLLIKRNNIIIDLGFYSNFYNSLIIINFNWHVPFRAFKSKNLKVSISKIEFWLKEELDITDFIKAQTKKNPALTKPKKRYAKKQ